MPETNGRPDDATIYAIALDSLLAPILPHPRDVIVVDSTRILPRFIPGTLRSLYALVGSDSSAVSDFALRAETPVPLAELAEAIQARVHFNVQFISDRVLRHLPQKDTKQAPGSFVYWSSFGHRFPGSTGSVTFTAIGYSKSRELAVLLLSYSCGPLCGAGYTIVMRRDSEVWHIAQARMDWIS